VIAAIVDTKTLGKVVVYSLVTGVGITTVFAVGVASVSGMVDALRRRRSVLGATYAAIALVCALATVGAIVLGLVVMASK
jgi:hypothetical protein